MILRVYTTDDTGIILFMAQEPQIFLQGALTCCCLVELAPGG